MPDTAKPTGQPYLWAAPGDVNAFFGLMLDNVAQLLLTVSLLSAVFAFPTNFALRYMVPGTDFHDITLCVLMDIKSGFV